MKEQTEMVKRLRGMAKRLTWDADLQKDLFQEMWIHLERMSTDRPGQTPSWYLQSCQFHALRCLKRGRSVDSHKRGHLALPLNPIDADNERSVLDPPDSMDVRDELMARDLVDSIRPRLTGRQQQVLTLLLDDFGIREIGRELNISHPTVLKHREKIARVASFMLADTLQAA